MVRSIFHAVHAYKYFQHRHVQHGEGPSFSSLIREVHRLQRSGTPDQGEWDRFGTILGKSPCQVNFLKDYIIILY